MIGRFQHWLKRKRKLSIISVLWVSRTKLALQMDYQRNSEVNLLSFYVIKRRTEEGLKMKEERFFVDLVFFRSRFLVFFSCLTPKKTFPSDVYGLSLGIKSNIDRIEDELKFKNIKIDRLRLEWAFSAVLRYKNTCAPILVSKRRYV